MAKRVFVLSRQSLLGKGIEALLSQESGIEIITTDKELSEAVECILKNRPDVVIINCDDPEFDLSPAVSYMLRERLGIRIIGISLRDNEISIYREEQKQIRQLEDLLSAIQE
jgi:chemotaxis response regulator CheB